MKELEQAMNAALANMVTSGKLNEIIQANVQKSVEGVLGDCFRSYSPFQKALGEHINQTLHVNFDALGLAGYNDTLMKIIKTKIEASVFATAEKRIAEEMEELLRTPPAEIKLSELVKQFRDECRHTGDGHDRVTCHIVPSETSTGYVRVMLDEKPGCREHACRYDIAVTDKGEVYRLSLPYTGDVTKRIFAGPFYGFDRSLFQMYAAKTKLIIDAENVETGDY